MALNLGELTLKLSANMTDFEAKLNSAQRSVATAGTQMQKQFDGFGKSVSGLFVPVNSLGDKLETVSKVTDKTGHNMQTMGKHMHGAKQQAEGLVGTLSGMEAQMNLMMGGAALTAAVTAPFVLFAKSALDASIGFEDAFAGVRKTVDATEQEFGQIEDRFRSMAKTTPITANEFARIGELAGQLGVRGVDNLTGFTDVVAKMGVTTNLSTDEAATSFARFANIMQMPLEQADRLGSTIVDLGNNLATTEQEITQFALRISGAGKQVGLSEAQVLGFGAALSSVGINAEAGGTAISRVFAKLAVVVGKGGDDLKMFANVAGVSAQDFAKAFKEDAANATIMFIEGLKRIQDSGGNVFTVLEKLELEDIRVRDALLRTAGAGDVLRKSIDLASKAWESNTALNVEAAKRFDTTASRLQIMQNNFAEMGRRIADTFAPAINGVIGAFNDLFESLQNMPPLLQGLLVGVSALAAALGPLMLGLAGFGAISAGINMALPVLGKLWTAITGPAGLATMAIAGLIVGIGTFAAASKKAREESAKKQESLLKLSGRYEDLTKTMQNTTRTEAERDAADRERKKLIEEIGDLFPDLVKHWDDHGKAVELDTSRLRENTKAAEDNRRAKVQGAIDAAKERMASIERDIADLERLRSQFKASPDLQRQAEARGFGLESTLKNYADMIAERKRELDIARQGLTDAYVALSAPGKGPEDPGTISIRSERNRKTLPDDENIEEEVKAQRQALSALEYQLERLDSQWTVYSTSVGKAGVNAAYLANQKTYLTKRLELLDARLQELTTQYERSLAATGEYSETTMDLGGQLDRTRERIAKTRAEFKEISGPITGSKQALIALEHQLGRVDSQWAAYSAAVGKAAGGDVHLAKQKSYLTERLQILNAQVQELTSQYEQSRTETGEYSDATMALGSQLSRTRTEIAQTRAEFEEISGPIADAKKALTEAGTAVKDMQVWIGTLSGRLKTVEGDLNDTRKAMSELESATKDAQSGISNALGIMATRASEVEAEINRVKGAMRDLTSVKLKGEGAFEDQLFQLQQQEALLKLAINRMRRGGTKADDPIIKQMEKRLEEFGLLREKIQLERQIEVEPLRRELQRLTDDTRELTFEEAKAQILSYQNTLTTLNGIHTDMTTRLRGLQESVTPLIPSMVNANLSFEEAAAKVKEHREAIEENKAKLDELRTAESKQKNLLDEGNRLLQSYNDELKTLINLETQATSALQSLRDAAVAAAGAMLSMPSRSEVAPGGSGGGGGGGGGRIFAMAEGGILKKPIFAAGEAGPEIVAPLSKLDDLMAPMLNRVLDYIGGLGRSALGGDMQPAMAGVGSVTNNLRVFIGNRELYEVIVEANEDARKRGRS